ncbi:diiron oxygenase [Caulobacter sp.]|uniref:diiron oxygenase n=1 Tax=Caulobacter sp. TaxID=78 RepID=UPI003BAFB692
MIQDLSYERLLETSKRVNWRLEDIIGDDKPMDFSKPFLPESFARTAPLDFLTRTERLKLNQIRAFGYLAMFELVERCILPIIEDLAPSKPGQDPHRRPALVQFAAEEAKHIELFVRFRRAFVETFDVSCGFIGPAEDIGAAIRAHSQLGLALFVLGIEWSTQRHYVESVLDDEELDPQFKSLLKHHWLEESQHAKLDALVFYELAARASSEQIDQAVEDFLDIGAFLDGGLAEQVQLDLASLEEAIGRTLSVVERGAFVQNQHQAMRWTFLGSVMTNEGFLKAVEQVSPDGRARLESVAPAFC